MTSTFEDLELPAGLDRRGEPPKPKRTERERPWYRGRFRLTAEDRRRIAQRKDRDAFDLGTAQVLAAVRGGAETALRISDATGLDTSLVSRCLRRLVHRRQLRKLSPRRYATR